MNQAESMRGAQAFKGRNPAGEFPELAVIQAKLWEGGGKGHFMSVYLMSENRDATFQLDSLAKYVKTDDEKLHLFLVLQSEK